MIRVDRAWSIERFDEKIRSIAWAAARDDARRFIPLRRRKTLEA
jgi:hypothetical protein